MVDVQNVRSAHGRDAFIEELDEILDSVYQRTKQVSEDFFVSFANNPNSEVLAAWLEPRAWRHIESLFVLNEGLRRYGLNLERKHISMLAKKSHQHAQHYVLIGKVIESLGGTVPVSVPEALRPWSELLWDCLDRHPLAAIAAAHCSEVSATGSFQPLLAAGKQHGYDEVVKVYQTIETDETFFHVGLARQVLATYAETKEDIAEALRAAHEMHDIAWNTFTPAEVLSLTRGATNKN